MRIARSLEDPAVRGARSVVLAIGVYDGVHLGHRRVLGMVVKEARGRRGTAACLTFDPHPSAVAEGAGTKLLASLEHRIELISALGLELCVILSFDRGLARQSGADFIVARLLPAMDLKVVCIGPGFVFGRDRGGGAALLRELGAAHGFSVVEVGGVEIDGVRVSSTVIREMVRRGDLDSAARFLGRRYSLLGKVVEGKALGRELGIPTANVKVAGEILPPPGVYTAAVTLRGRRRPGVLNIDFAGVIEVHILDFEGALYGQKVEVVPEKFIRAEQRFASREELVSRIRCDIAIAREILHNEGRAHHSGCAP